MDSRKHHFPVTPGHQLNLSLHILRLPASDPASGIGDNAVAAELVAAVLYFNKGTRMFCLLFNMEFLVLI